MDSEEDLQSTEYNQNKEQNLESTSDTLDLMSLIKECDKSLKTGKATTIHNENVGTDQPATEDPLYEISTEDCLKPLIMGRSIELVNYLADKATIEENKTEKDIKDANTVKINNYSEKFNLNIAEDTTKSYSFKTVSNICEEETLENKTALSLEKKIVLENNVSGTEFLHEEAISEDDIDKEGNIDCNEFKDCTYVKDDIDVESCETIISARTSKDVESDPDETLLSSENNQDFPIMETNIRVIDLENNIGVGDHVLPDETAYNTGAKHNDMIEDELALHSAVHEDLTKKKVFRFNRFTISQVAKAADYLLDDAIESVEADNFDDDNKVEDYENDVEDEEDTTEDTSDEDGLVREYRIVENSFVEHKNLRPILKKGNSKRAFSHGAAQTEITAVQAVRVGYFIAYR